MSLLTCQYSHHEESQILGVCIDKKCKYTRVYCVACKVEFHKGHEDQLKPLQSLKQWIALNFNYYQNLINFNGSILQFQNLLIEAINLLHINKDLDINHMNTTQLQNYINKLLVVEEIETKVCKQIKSIYNEIDVFQSVCKTALQPLYVIKDQKIKEDIQQVDKISQIQIQNLQPQKVGLLKFSEKYRNTGNTGIEKDGKQANGIGYIMCDYIIPKNGETLLSFNYVSGFSLGVGLCHRKKLIALNFQIQQQQLSSQGHGLYLIQSNGICYSHLDPSINGKSIKEKLFPNDIIQLKIRIQQQLVTWYVNKKEIQTMSIDTTQDLCPIIDICGVVQIIDEQ